MESTAETVNRIQRDVSVLAVEKLSQGRKGHIGARSKLARGNIAFLAKADHSCSNRIFDTHKISPYLIVDPIAPERPPSLTGRFIYALHRDLARLHHKPLSRVVLGHQTAVGGDVHSRP